MSPEQDDGTRHELLRIVSVHSLEKEHIDVDFSRDGVAAAGEKQLVNART